MMVLHIRVSDTPDGQMVEVDRLTREDATEKERKTADTIHDFLERGFERSPTRYGSIQHIKPTATPR
jgi:hypothetical protein